MPSCACPEKIPPLKLILVQKMNSRYQSHPKSSKSIAQPPLRVGLVGVTGYAQAYCEGLQMLAEQGEVAWAAVTIIDRSAAPGQVNFFESKGVPIYDDFETMLDREADRLDWVCLPTGIGWHRSMTIECLRRGLPVLVEKPLAPTLQDVAMIQTAEQEAGLPVAVGFQYMYIDETWEIKKRLLAGEIGEIRRVDCLALWPRGQSYYERNGWSGKLHDGSFWILDSPLHNALSHLANLILFWTGSRLEAGGDLRSVKAELYRAKSISSYDTLRSEAEVDNGVPVSVILSHSTLQKFDPEIRITGTKGTFTWRFCGHHSFEVAGEIESFRMPCLVPIRERMFCGVSRYLRGEPIPMCTTELAKGPVKWVNAVHDTAPIAEVPSRYRRRVEDDAGEVFDTVEDLEYYLMRAYHERRSLADLGVPWAVGPGERDLRDYAAFEGRFMPPPVPPIP